MAIGFAARRMLKALLPTGAAVLIALAVSADVASADVRGYFCPSTGGNTIALGPYPSRCVGVYHSSYEYVTFKNYYSPVTVCAVVKPNSDGSGGNVWGQVSCTYEAIVAFGVPGAPGYATGMNWGPNYHTRFAGTLGYYTCRDYNPPCHPA